MQAHIDELNMRDLIPKCPWNLQGEQMQTARVELTQTVKVEPTQMAKVAPKQSMHECA